MTDQEIVQKLIERNNDVTNEFFFKTCKPMFYAAIKSIYSNELKKEDYGELINELYIYLIKNDAKVLKTFNFKSSLKTWMCVVSSRFFLQLKKMGKIVIDNDSQDPLISENNKNMATETTTTNDLTSKQWLTILSQMPTKQYAKVLYHLLFKNMTNEEIAIEINMSLDNFYNVKSRAIKQLTAVAKEYIRKHPEEFDDKF